MKLQITLRTRIVMLVVAAIVPLIGLAIFNARLDEDIAIDRATVNLKTSAALVAANQDRVVNSAYQMLLAMANAPGLVEGKPAECQRYLKGLKDALPIYANLGIIDLDGHFRCDGMGTKPSVFVGDRSYFQAVIARRGFVADGYVLSRLSGKPIVPFAMPVMDREGQVKAVAFVILDLNEMSKALATAPLPPGGRLVIMDRQGTVLVANPPKSLLVGRPVPSPLILEAVKSMRTGVVEGSDAKGSERIYAFLPSGNSDSPFFVALSADLDGVVAPARKQLVLELLVLALVAFLSGGLAWLMGGRSIVKPAAEILEAIRQVREGGREVRIPAGLLGGGDEFARIAGGFKLMAESLRNHHDALGAELAYSQAVQQKLQDVQRLGRIGYWQVDLNTQLIWWSDEVYELLGMDHADFDGTYADFLPRVHPGDRESYDAQRSAALQAGLPLDIEFRIVTAAGAVRWMHQSERGRIHDENAPITVRSGVIQDITEQHEAQAHLRLLETCISRLNDMVMIIKVYPGERRTSILFVNEAFTRQMGYSRQEAVGQSTALLHGPKTEGAGLSRIIASIRSCEPVRAELIHYTKSGKEVWVETDLVPLFDAKGGVTDWVSVERDITQRKMAEQALMDSEQRYTALFEKAPVPMWVFDAESYQFLTVNAAAVQAYGYSEAEFLSMTIYDIRSETEAKALRAQQAISPLVLKNRWEHRRKDGTLFTARPYSKPIQYAGGPAHFVVALDISPQVKAEQDAQDQMFTLQRAADAAQAITWHHTLQGTMQEVVEQARGVIGTHQAVVSLTHGSDWAQAISALSLSEKYAKYRGPIGPMDGGGIMALVCETNHPMRLTQAELEAHPRWRGFGSNAGKHSPMRGWLAIPLTGRNGKNIGLLQLSDKYEGEFTQQDEYIATELAQLASTAIENSQLLEEVNLLNTGLEQKVAERTVALVRQEALFRALAEQAPQVVWTADPRGHVTYANRAWFDLVGGQADDWTGTKWFTAIHPQDLPDVHASWQLARSSLSQFAGTRRVRAKDGSFHTMTYRASPVLNDEGEVTFWVGIDADITEFKAIESALRLSNQELEAFSYSVSHDLRSPLNTIDGFSRLLAKQLAGHAGEKMQHYLSRIQAGTAQMGQLIEGLLSLSQVSRMHLQSDPVDLSVLARGILDDWHARQPERHVSVYIESGLQAHGDARLVRVVMENLLANAWKFSSHQAQAEISVGQQLDAAGLPEFFVRDNGAGFDMAYADKLFSPFQRLHGVSEFPGTGIGLATVSRVIMRHAGRLWADSAPGRGATFFFTLPKLPVVA